MERILCRIEYVAEYSPNVRILINQKPIITFIGNKNFYEFDFEVDTGEFDFTIEHFGKDMKKESNKFLEIKKIYFEDIDIKDMIWMTTQIAEIPAWQNKNDFNWQGNLYLGHNDRLTYKLQSPIIEYLFNYHQPQIKNKENIATSDNFKLLSEMKSYFEEKIKEQKRK
jgi:hypothetical protein